MRESKRPKLSVLLVTLLLAVVTSACGSQEGATPAATPEPTIPSQPAATMAPSPGHSPTDTVQAHSETNLAPATELESNCLNWPEEELSPSNSATAMTSLAPGDPAIDFTLQDVDGTAYTLSDLLEAKPVLLVLGGFT